MSITITNGTLTATINPKGAELNSLTKNGQEFIWEGNPAFWGKHSPVLFPIVGTLKDNTYTYNGQQYNFPRHGFARDNDFVLTANEGHSATFTLIANEELKKNYPFDFQLELIYTLHESELTLQYRVTNSGANALPFSIGAHPAFALPGNFEDYSLQFEKDEPLVSTQLVNDLLSDTIETLPATNGNLPLTYSLFEKDALIFKALESKSLTIKKGDADYLAVRFADFPHLGIWTKVGAPFLCIEPWQGYSDAQDADGDITKKDGIINLAPGAAYNAAFTVTVF